MRRILTSWLNSLCGLTVISFIFQNELAYAAGVLLSSFVFIFSTVLSKVKHVSFNAVYVNICKVPRQRERSGQTYQISP